MGPAVAKRLGHADVVDAARFWSQVRVGSGAECWLWVGAVNHAGYGRPRLGGRRFLAHRAAFVLARGEIPAGLCVCHRCDTPACVNPGHLFLGTVAENFADMRAKGRHVRGDGSPHARLSERDVLEIRAMRQAGAPFERIGSKFGVSHQIARDIALGLRWRHVGGPRDHVGSHSPVKLSTGAALEMRALHAAGVSTRRLGKRFGVSQQTASKVILGRIWRETGVS